MKSKYEMIAQIRLAEATATRDLRNRWNEVRSLLEQGLEFARQHSDDFWEAYHLMRLGQYHILLGDYYEGENFLKASLNAIERIKEQEREQRARWQDEEVQQFQVKQTGPQEYRWLEAEAWRGLAVASLGQGQADLALIRAEKATATGSEYGEGWKERGRITEARVLQSLGRKQEALGIIENVLPAVRSGGWRSDEQEALHLQGLLLLEMGLPGKAEGPVRQALKMAQEMELKEEEVKCLLSLGQVLLALKRPQEARGVLQQARRLSQERGYTDHFQRADELLHGGE